MQIISEIIFILMNCSLFLNTVLSEAIHAFQKYTVTKGIYTMFLWLQDIITKFCSVPEPEFPGHVILEQYQAQVGFYYNIIKSF